MRRPVLFILTGVIVLLLGTASVLFQLYRKAVAMQRDSVARGNTERSHYDRAFGAIAEIQDSLNAIATGSALMALSTESHGSRGGTVEQRKRRALDRIAAVDARIRENKAKILLLEGEIQKGGVKTVGLEKTIAALKQSVARAEGTVAQLKGRVKAMTTRVATLEDDVHEKNDSLVAHAKTIEEKRRELATVHYIIGSKKELTERNLVVGDGGVLGLGRSLQVSRHLSDATFTPWDTDRITVIRFPARKAVVLSAQPSSSYSLEPDGDQMTLTILDAGEFRKVKQLVIRTK